MHEPNPVGLCECGCGQPSGMVGKNPRRFAPGHSAQQSHRREAEARRSPRHDGPRINAQEKTERACLKCSKMFMSEGNWNRLCAHCHEGIAASPSDEKEYRLATDHRHGVHI